ncbi:MAG: aminopeptidase [Bacilli bacterium]|nr:aminopeptidase [Bacilli bacterium]
MEQKYIELLLEKCINFDKSKSLFISYDVIVEDFVRKVVKYANDMGINDIYLDKTDVYYESELLNKLSIEDIEKEKYFDTSIWDLYASKNASFLIIKSPVPGVMDDIPAENIAKVSSVRQSTMKEFKKKQLNYEVPWCICSYPNRVWAKDIFKEDNAYELLSDMIYKICMVDTDNPIVSWDNYLKENKKIIDKLNNLKLKELHYKNSIGTDLVVELLSDTIWSYAASNGLVNMPSYEVFTCPNYKQTNGIVYSSKPLIYGGGKINDFWLEFKDGKVVNFDAKVGKDLLKGILESDGNSSYLGECALVPYDSPISNTDIVFGTTLIDENASCHLALGSSYCECIKNGFDLSEEELLENGLNVSSEHVDFMIGTEDLEIIGTTFHGEKVKIFENGNFSL